MSDFIPFDMLSKKAKKEFHVKRRKSWGTLNPVTRKPENPKAYKRSKKKNRTEEDDFRM